VFGICMGHQILGQAFGGKTFKLKFGHHGGNHPIRYNPTGGWLVAGTMGVWWSGRASSPRLFSTAACLCKMCCNA
jgi:GMP synthase-like glutamine amidotransferase